MGQRQRNNHLSLDAPSGVDTTSGTVLFRLLCQRHATLTLPLPNNNEGLRATGVEDQVNELYLDKCSSRAVR
jgi:NAD(P)H-hydrate repair Nnr-like enzyme with NAD(P)H-hydrate epimerase domain